MKRLVFQIRLYLVFLLITMLVTNAITAEESAQKPWLERNRSHEFKGVFKHLSYKGDKEEMNSDAMRNSLNECKTAGTEVCQQNFRLISQDSVGIYGYHCGPDRGGASKILSPIDYCCKLHDQNVWSDHPDPDTKATENWCGMGACVTCAAKSANLPTQGSEDIASSKIDPGFHEGRAWVNFNDDPYADYCRVVATKNDKRKVSCTLSEANVFGKTIDSHEILAGDSNSRYWVDVNGDGFADFCRAKWGGDSWARCVVSNGKGFDKKEVNFITSDVGWSAGRAWVKFDKNDDNLYLCRSTGRDGDYIICSNSAGTEYKSEPMDVGFDSTQQWGDINGDGHPDYCRVVGKSNQKVLCTLTKDKEFGETITYSGDVGRNGTQSLVDFSGDMKHELCVVQKENADRIECSRYNTASKIFDTTYLSGELKIPGEDHGRAWVDFDGDGKADYCRVVDHVLGGAYACTYSTGTGFGATVVGSSLIMDIGFHEGRAWADFNGDGRPDYCRVTKKNNQGEEAVLRCWLTSAGFEGEFSAYHGIGDFLKLINTPKQCLANNNSDGFKCGP